MNNNGNKKNQYARLYKKINKNISLISKEDKEGKRIYSSFDNGKMKVLSFQRKESAAFDVVWLDKIEDTLNELLSIVQNPRKVIKSEGNVIPVELAKKTNNESIRHLASHSQFVKNIDEEGNITPNKILSFTSDDDYNIYENRFIATLIKRLVIFVEKRYEYLIHHSELSEYDSTYYKIKTVVDGQEVEIETKINIKKSMPEEIVKEPNEYLFRVKKVRDYLRYLYTSPFMKMFKNDKEISGRIIQTNIIRKNPTYRKCFQLYKFLEGYVGLGVNYKVEETYLSPSEDDLESYKNNLFATYLINHNEVKEITPIKEVTKKNKPVILKNIDDELFTYGDLLDKEISFVRIDDKYLKQKEEMHKTLPVNPKKKEKEYYQEQYEEKKENKEEIKLTKALLKRQKEEEILFKKKQAELIQKQKKEEERLKKEEEERIRLYNENLLNEARKLLQDDSRNYVLDESNIIENKIKQKELDKQKVNEVIESETLEEEENEYSLIEDTDNEITTNNSKQAHKGNLKKWKNKKRKIKRKK
ncbi:MAG: hypothetical protein ACI31G_00045 [Bacilli bacterium]